jgi:hypothetical protein
MCHLWTPCSNNVCCDIWGFGLDEYLNCDILDYDTVYYGASLHKFQRHPVPKEDEESESFWNIGNRQTHDGR